MEQLSIKPKGFKIQIERCEGPTDECVLVETEAIITMKKTFFFWALTAPKNEGYNKVRVNISTDEASLSFRLDMTYNKFSIRPYVEYFIRQWNKPENRETKKEREEIAKLLKLTDY